MKVHKRVLRNGLVRWLISWAASLYIRLVHATGRWTVVRDEIPRRFWDAGEPFILAFWHGRMLMTPYSWNRAKAVQMLVSGHPDAQLGAKVMARLGIRSVVGSSRRGGTAGLRAMVKTLKAKQYVGIAPDGGPRGPRLRAALGAVRVARLAGVPIIPMAYGIDRRIVLRSWDRFVIAKPFGRGHFVWGEPIEVPRDADGLKMEELRAKVEDGLNAVTNEADRLSGHDVIEPAEAAS